MNAGTILEPSLGKPQTIPARPRIVETHSLPMLGLILLFLALLLISSELICRFAIGLGDPPLYMADPAMEYLLQPSKTYTRFHNRFSTNRYSMRSDDFPPHKSSANEFRLLVVGDSVIYGGVRIDQHDLDTEILRRDLQQQLGRPVVVGNASAKSWGPPNELAYLKHYGTLDADVVILELSSHDYADSPTFIPVVGISADYPNRKPTFALLDLVDTYLLPHYFHIGANPEGIDKLVSVAPPKKDVYECLNAERDFFSFAREHGAKVALVQHLTAPELSGPYQTGYFANKATAAQQHVPIVDDAAELREQIRSGKRPFFEGDPIHLAVFGQRALGDTLRKAVYVVLNRKSSD